MSTGNESPLLRKRVGQLMTRSPVTCRPYEPVSRVAFLMAENSISSVVVVEGREADNYINPHRLSRFEQSLVKNALSAITRLQKLTGSRFKYY